VPRTRRRGTAERLPSTSTDTADATIAELTAAGVLETVPGACAVVLARRIDTQLDSGAGLGQLTRQHAASLRDALSRVRPAPTELERARARRGWRRGDP
jgi:hypothetical protein